VPNFTDHLGGNVKLIAAHGLNNSDCFCETPSQVIDAGVDMQFENIEQALREE
jgi:flagellar biosynthesis/type III secretory pathway protein FliH